MIEINVTFPLLIHQKLSNGSVLNLMCLNLGQVLEVFDLQPAGKTLPELRDVVHQFSTELINKPHLIIDPDVNKLQIKGVFNICSKYDVRLQTKTPMDLIATFEVHVP